MRGRSIVASLLAAATLSCTSDPGPPRDSARVSVELLRGFSPEDVAPREGFITLGGTAFAADLPTKAPIAPAPVGKGKAPIVGKGKAPVVTRG